MEASNALYTWRIPNSSRIIHHPPVTVSIIARRDFQIPELDSKPLTDLVLFLLCITTVQNYLHIVVMLSVY
jgi:hypothetical protein